ncbi:hypothetical protein [Paludisphaera mucosa]|uniref:hypothetical protein n=1 Tax=Paludisphaera mucosa TaxID=3030827 RepID=UPI0034A2ECF8
MRGWWSSWPACRNKGPVPQLDRRHRRYDPGGSVLVPRDGLAGADDARVLAERSRAGLDAALRRGRVGGRKLRMTPGDVESARKLLGGGMPPRDVDGYLGASVPKLYRWMPPSSRRGCRLEARDGSDESTISRVASKRSDSSSFADVD